MIDIGRPLTPLEKALIPVTILVVLFFGLRWINQAVGGTGENSPSQIQISLEGSSARLQSLTNSVAKLKNQMDLGDFELPALEDSPKVFSYIDETARSAGLEFARLTETGPSKGKKFQVMRYRFQATSELNALVKFVDTIQTGKYLVALENWDMKPVDNSAKLTANLSLRAYFKPAAKGR